MLYRMTIMASPIEHHTSSHLRASRARHPAPTTQLVCLRLLDGGAPGGQLSGAVRHAIEARGALTPAQRLSIAAPADLPRLYTQAEADVLVAALRTAGADVLAAWSDLHA